MINLDYVDAVKKEAGQLKKEGAKAYANKKVEQAKAVINAVNNANQTIIKNPKKALETTGKFVADNAKETVKKLDKKCTLLCLAL